MNTLSKSPNRHTFQAESSKKKLEEDPNDESAKSMLDFYQSWRDEADAREKDPEWQKNNMEYDMRTCDWMLAKVRERDGYAQNLYAAICNNDFIKIEVIPMLRQDPEKDYWGASWRSAGGIVANMRQEGDYIDWYCSGIRGGPLGGAEDENAWDARGYVPEGKITDEIRSDLQSLGWAVAPGGDWEKFI
jgi:hypothetical protein